MNRFEFSVQSLSAGVAAAGGLGAYFSGAQEVVLQVFGVPLPVVLAAATGAFGARSFLEPVGFWRALSASLMWTAVGAFCTALGLWLFGLWIGREVPTTATAGVALFIAAGLELLVPVVLPVIRLRVPGLVNSFFDRFNKKGSGDA